MRGPNTSQGANSDVLSLARRLIEEHLGIYGCKKFYETLVDMHKDLEDYLVRPPDALPTDSEGGIRKAT